MKKKAKKEFPFDEVPDILDCGHPPDPGKMATIRTGRTTRQVMGWRFVLRDGKKICHACDSLRILDCGHSPSSHESFTTGTAHMPDGREICYECADASQREDLKDRSKPFGAYFAGDGKAIQTWSGGHLMKVIHSWPCGLGRKSHWHSQASYRCVRALDVHGHEWYGRGSPGVCITMRARTARKRPAKPAAILVAKSGPDSVITISVTAL